jgi:hypothetical protein
MRHKHAQNTPYLYCPYKECDYKTTRGDVLYRHFNSDKHKIKKKVDETSHANKDIEGTQARIGESNEASTSAKGLSEIIPQYEVRPPMAPIEPPSITDSQAIMAGRAPPGSENYSSIVYGTIDTDKLHCLLKNSGPRVNQDTGIDPIPHSSHQCAGPQPILAQVCHTNNSTTITSEDITPNIADNIINNSSEIQFEQYQVENNLKIPNMQITGQDIINIATAQITNKETLPTLQHTHEGQEGSPITESLQMPTRSEELADESHNSTEDDDTDSIIEDMIVNYTTTIDIMEEETTPDTPETIPRIFNEVTQPPVDMNTSTPIVRVALMDFQFKPTPGEVYVVNSEGHLIKMNQNIGSLFQVNALGLLQEVFLPIPVMK